MFMRSNVFFMFFIFIFVDTHLLITNFFLRFLILLCRRWLVRKNWKSKTSLSINSKNSSTKKLNINNCFCISITLIKNIKFVNFSNFFLNQMFFFFDFNKFFLFLESWMTWSKRLHFNQFLFFTWMTYFFFYLSIQLWFFIINVFF